MKAFSLNLFLAALLLGIPAAAGAQTHDFTPRADAWGAIGWRHDHHEGDGYRADGNRRVVADGGVGLYWRPQLKTEVDTGTIGRDAYISSSYILSNNRSTYRSSRVEYQTWTMAVTQIYELVPNAWFTPYAGVGFDVARQTRETYLGPLFSAGPSGRQTLLEPEREDETRRTLIRPVAAFGFKGYMTRRAFVRGDVRLSIRGGVDEMRFRFGFGFDF
jgi:opacity protein-like surface antigen